MNNVIKKRQIILAATECKLTSKDISPFKPKTYFPIQIENSFPVDRFNNILKKGVYLKRCRESCAYVDSLVTSVFFLLCSNNVFFLLSLLTHPTLAHIDSTSSSYLLHFIPFQISSQITMNKIRLSSPHNRHSYPSSIKEVCHHGPSWTTCHESPTAQWMSIWSTNRTVVGLTPIGSTPSSFFLSIPVSFPEGNHLSLFISLEMSSFRPGVRKLSEQYFMVQRLVPLHSDAERWWKTNTQA